jgi:hypothetical protein
VNGRTRNAKAEDFETIARRHAALPESRQSFGTRLAVFARLMMAPMLPGFNPEIYDRAQEQPVPPTPHLALDDAGWTASHRCRGLSCGGRYFGGSTGLIDAPRRRLATVLAGRSALAVHQ